MIRVLQSVSRTVFNDAFVSRVHIQLRRLATSRLGHIYEELAKERSDCMRLNIDAKQYIRGAEVQNIKNGREIRNGELKLETAVKREKLTLVDKGTFQTAVALAEYNDKRTMRVKSSLPTHILWLRWIS